jgi:hypothetical protein
MARRQHRVRIYGEPRREPDLRRLSKVIIELAQAQAEAEAEAEHAKRRKAKPDKGEESAGEAS